MIRAAILLALFVATSASPARASEATLLGGIVTDQTITPAGQDFYKIFTALWHDKPLNERFNIAMRERPSARLGNWIHIEYGNRTVFQALLPTARGNIRALGERAVDIVYENISAAETARLLFRDDDLAGDEF